MTTSADVKQYRTTQTQLETVALAEVNKVLSVVGDADPVVVRNTLIQVLPDVIGPYITAAGELSATWYEDLRRAAVGGTFYATSSGAVNTAQVEALVRWGVRPLFGQGGSTVLSLVGGGVQRMVADAGRNTIQTNVIQDRVRVGYARIPQPGCCAFCGMLASRGAVYNSSESAGGVIGRGVDPSVTAGHSGGQGQGLKMRGSQSVGKQYHDFDRCAVAPVFEGDSFAADSAGQYKALYQDAVQLKESSYSKENGLGWSPSVTDTKSTLAAWRIANGTN